MRMICRRIRRIHLHRPRRHRAYAVKLLLKHHHVVILQYSILHFLFHPQVLRTRICFSCCVAIPCLETPVVHSYECPNNTKYIYRVVQNKFWC